MLVFGGLSGVLMASIPNPSQKIISERARCVGNLVKFLIDSQA